MQVCVKASYLVVLVSCHCDELCLREDVCPEGAVGQFEHVVRLHDVKSWLIFVHRVENCLQIKHQNVFLIFKNNQKLK